MNDKQKIDRHFTCIWAEYEAHLAGRGVLDERIRRLAVIGQCATMGEVEEVEAQIREALDVEAASPSKSWRLSCRLAYMSEGRGSIGRCDGSSSCVKNGRFRSRI